MVWMTSVRLPPDYATTLRHMSARLRRTRRALGLTQDQLAERAGVHRNTIQNLEADHFTTTPSFRIDILLAVAHALGMDGPELFAPEA
jgi:transcriptional regulator with XRE-family HTH domain